MISCNDSEGQREMLTSLRVTVLPASQPSHLPAIPRFHCHLHFKFCSLCVLRHRRRNDFKDRSVCVRMYTVILCTVVSAWVSCAYKPNVVNITKSRNSKAKGNIMGDSYWCLYQSPPSVLCKCAHARTPETLTQCL